MTTNTLLEDFQRDTIILANGIFDNSSGETAYASDFLTRKDLLLAAGQYGVNIYVPGHEFELAELLKSDHFRCSTKHGDSS